MARPEASTTVMASVELATRDSMKAARRALPSGVPRGSATVPLVGRTPCGVSRPGRARRPSWRLPAGLDPGHPPPGRHLDEREVEAAPAVPVPVAVGVVGRGPAQDLHADARARPRVAHPVPPLLLLGQEVGDVALVPDVPARLHGDAAQA